MRSSHVLKARATGAARLVGAVAGLAVPPLLLARVIGNPLPSWPVDWTGVAEALRLGLVPSSVWVDVLGVVAWLTWAVLLAMLLVEVLAVVRDRPSPSVVPVLIRRLAQVLVSAALALAGPAQSAASVTGERIMVAAAAPAGDPSPVESPVVRQVDGGRLVTVGEGDSWAGFAADVVGDSTLGSQLRDANLGRVMEDGTEITEATAFVEPGWRLVVPPELDRQPVRTLSPSDTRDADGVVPAAGDEEAEQSLVEVEAGDHFWKIAEETLTKAWDREPSEFEVAGYWTDLVDANRDRLLPPGDPDLIHPGQTFVTPPTPADPEDPMAAPASSVGDGTGDSAPGVTSGRPVAGPGAHGAADLGRGLGSPPVVDGDAEPEEGLVASRDGAARESDNQLDGEDEAELERVTSWGVSAHLPAGLAASGLLAAGVTAIVRTRRRDLLRRRRPGMRLPTPAPEVVHELGRLDAAAPSEEILDDLVSLLCSIPEEVHPTVVVTVDDGIVELLFDDDRPVPDPVSPWALLDHGDGPVGWSATIGDEGPTRSYGLPLLVTAGKADDRILHVNVGAVECLAVSGPDEDVARSLHRMTMEVAASPVLGPVEVAVVGDGRLVDWYRVEQADDGSVVVEQATEEREQVSIHDRLPRLVVCHPNTPVPARPAERDVMVGMVVANRDEPGAWELSVQPDGVGRLHLPDGATVEVTVPDVDTDLLEQEIAALRPDCMVSEAEADAVPAEPAVGDVLDHAPDLQDEPDGHPADTSATVPPQHEDTPWCDVRILGPVQVVRDGEQLDDVRGLPLQVLTYLVAHPEGVTPDQLEADVWGHSGGRDSQRAKAVLIRLRRMLGDGPDGEPLIPNRAPGDRLLMLSKHVSSDAERAMAHLDKARHLTDDERLRELSAALDLVRGEPFQDLPMSWTTVHGQQLVARLQDAALEVAAAHRVTGAHDVAEDAIHRGLSLCPYTETLYEEWARIVSARDHPEQVRQIKDQFRRVMGPEADEVDTTAIDEAAASQHAG